MNKDSKELLTAKPLQILIKLSLPAILGMIVIGLYPLMDGIFAGQILGEKAMTAVGIATPFTYINTGIATLIGVGSASLLSRAIGEGNQKIIDKVMGNLCFWILTLSTIVTVLGILFCQQLLSVFGAKGELLNLSTLKMTKSPVFKGEDFVQEVKVGEKTKLTLKRKLSPQEREAFVDTYLHEGLERFTSNPKALSSLPNADTLAFILLSGVALNKDDVIDGVEAQVFLPDQYTDAALATQNGQDRYIYPNGSTPIGNNKPVVNPNNPVVNPNNPVVNPISPNPSPENINNFVENVRQKPESGNDINNNQLDEALSRHGYNGRLLLYDKVP